MRWFELGGLFLVLATACVNNPNLRGPLPVRNQHPAQLTVMHLDPANAAVLGPGDSAWRADVAYTSLFLSGRSANAEWLMDGEYLRAALTGRIGLGAGLEISVQLPSGHTSGGFLDDLLIEYHDHLGLPDQDRTTNERDSFAIQARSGFNNVFAVEESQAEWLDVPLVLTWQLREPGQDRLGLAIRGGLELPTGDQDRGYGNGQLDTSIGVVADYRAAGIGLMAHAQHTFAGSPRPARMVGFRFEDVSSVGAGIELPLATGLHALIQSEWETSTLRELGPESTKRDQVLLWLGGRWQVDQQWSVEIGVAEDLVGFVSPDVTLWLAMTWVP